MWRPFLFWAGLIPSLVLLAVVFFERWQRKRKGERPPISEKLLRPAGYSLQQKLEDLNDANNLQLVGTFLFSLAAVGCFSFVPTDYIGRIIFLTVFGLCAAGCTVMAWRTLLKIRNYRRGLLGEQAVAEQLQRLLPLGYRVFHDVPGDGKWNVDHVVVGPAGVFAIETKYRTKSPSTVGECEAVFDGNKIQYPSSYDANAHKQAVRNADWLTNMLSKAASEPVEARPVVALPGWKVSLKVRSYVKVLSGKYVPDFISTEPALLSDKIIQQISYQLEQRCRDVEV
jgi:Nuclease-related domain